MAKSAGSRVQSSGHSLTLGKQLLQTLAFQSRKWVAAGTSCTGVQNSGQHAGVLGVHRLPPVPVSPFQLHGEPRALAVLLLPRGGS